MTRAKSQQEWRSGGVVEECPRRRAPDEAKQQTPEIHAHLLALVQKRLRGQPAPAPAPGPDEAKPQPPLHTHTHTPV